jgi:hypothetical protein
LVRPPRFRAISTKASGSRAFCAPLLNGGPPAPIDYELRLYLARRSNEAGLLTNMKDVSAIKRRDFENFGFMRW